MPKKLIAFPDDMFSALRQRAGEAGVPASECVREAVRRWLDAPHTSCHVVLSGGVLASGSILVVRVG